MIDHIIDFSVRNKLLVLLLVGAAALAAFGGISKFVKKGDFVVKDLRLADFGRLDYAQTMRWVIPGSTLVVLGFQTPVVP